MPHPQVGGTPAQSPEPVQQELELARVRARIGDTLEGYYRVARIFPDKRFTAELLTAHVRRVVPGAPDSAMRVLRDLRKHGRVNYRCISRAESRYEWLPLPAAATISDAHERGLELQLARLQVAQQRVLNKLAKLKSERGLRAVSP